MSVNIYDKENDKLNLVAGGTLYADSPIGSIMPYGGATAPSGWFICDGTELVKTSYPELFAVIGTSFGTPSDNTKFCLPDLREATTKGVGLSGKSNNHYDADGLALGEFIDDRLQTHTHTYNASTTPGQNGTGVPILLGGSSSTSGNNSGRSGTTTEVKSVGVNYIIKAKQIPIPADFASSMIGYLGQETNYNLYPWSHERTEETPDTNQDITIERDGWYSIDYTLTNNTNVLHTFTLRDFDSQGEVHTIMRAHYDKSGTFRQTFLVPLKAGTYRYSHGGIGTLSVYMNRRDFA